VLVPLCGTGDELELLAEVCRARIVVGNEIDQTPIAVFFRRLLGSHLAPALMAGATALPYFAQQPAPSLPAGVTARDGSAGKWFGVSTTTDTTIGILQADFLALNPDSMRATLPSALPFDAVLDIRAFVAVRPGPQRTRYAYQLRRLVRPGSRLLIVLLLPFGADQQGVRLPRSTPPYIVTDQEVQQLFRPYWQMQPVGLPTVGRHGREQTFIAVRNSAF
jgi:SAM-dependent methyltransferase